MAAPEKRYTPPMATSTRPIRLWNRTGDRQQDQNRRGFVLDAPRGSAAGRAPISDIRRLLAGGRRQNRVFVDAARRIRRPCGRRAAPRCGRKFPGAPAFRWKRPECRGPSPANARETRVVSPLAPTSTPRVGSSSSSSNGSPSTSFASTTFCWLPPGQRPGGDTRVVRTDVELLERAGPRRRSPWRSTRNRTASPADDGHHQIRPTDIRSISPPPRRSSVTKAMPRVAPRGSRRVWRAVRRRRRFPPMPLRARCRRARIKARSCRRP